MDKSNITREELFALVWEKPSTEVAKELHISDVALGKLCHRLQVPKPPRGYWARVKSGKVPRQSPLKGFKEEINKKIKRASPDCSFSTKPSISLSEKQIEYFRRAVREMDSYESDISLYEISRTRVKITPEFAARVLIYTQNRYTKWVEETAFTPNARAGAYSSVSNLVSKLLTVASPQTVLFRQVRDKHSYGNDVSVVVRFTRELQERIAYLRGVVKASNLSYVAQDMGEGTDVWSLHYLHSPSSYTRISSELCVSTNEVWIRCEMKSGWKNQISYFDTKRYILEHILPIDLIPPVDHHFPVVISKSHIKPYVERLNALKQSEDMFEAVYNSGYKLESSIPDGTLSMVERLWYGGDMAPFTQARRAWVNLEQELEQWEKSLESERAELCRDVLGIEKGHIVLLDSGGKATRILVESASAYVYESKVIFSLSGKRFRKDGTLGKRQEQVTISVDIE